MTAVKSFEDLEIWKESMSLVAQVYGIFRECRDFGFRDQIQRSAVSIPSNIAEGFERQTNKEFIQFLFIAKGSSAELRTQISLAIMLGYIEKINGEEILERTKIISSKIAKLITYRKNYNN